jgi:hypothetical protein
MKYIKVNKVKPVRQTDYVKMLGEVLKTIEPEYKPTREDLTKVLPVRTKAKRGAE